MGEYKAIIAEDSFITAYDIKRTLENIGIKTDKIVSNGEKVLDYVKELKPDIIIMDIKLRGIMNGIETAIRVKEDYDLPIIFISGVCEIEVMKNNEELNDCGFIMKPYCKAELTEKVSKILPINNFNKKHINSN